jgi:ParB-like chromosome segregation protein Spo0J
VTITLKSLGTTLETLRPHPAAAAFPMLEGKALEELAADIRTNGLLNAVVLGRDEHGETVILDGRNRLAACAIAKVKPVFDVYTGETDSIDYIVGQNIHRRHLTESQRAAIAATLAEMYSAEASVRMKSGKADPTADLRQGRAPTSAAKAAAAMQVSPRLVEAAIKVKREGVPELLEAVQHGEVAVSAAAEVAKEPRAAQAKVVAAGPAAVQQRAKVIRLEKKNTAPPTTKKTEAAEYLKAPPRGAGRIRGVHPHALAGWLVREWPRGHVEMLIEELRRLVPDLRRAP